MQDSIPSGSSATSTPAIDTIEIGHYLGLLFPDPPADAWLVVSWVDSARQFLSQWFRSPETDQAIQFLGSQAPRHDVYIALGLRHPDCTPEPATRGTSDQVYAISGLWIEFDHNAGAHASLDLPTPAELLTFIEDLPFHFSLLVDSTGGYHGYCLFKELWRLDTPEEHQAATLLLRRFQRTSQARAAERGWKVDTTSDLARVLRPSGTLNHKSGTPKPVTILHEDAIRYNPSDLADAPWLATIEDTYTPSARNGRFPPTPLQPIVEGCAWLRHCRGDAATLPEPEWYAMLGIVGRVVEGDTIAHEWSSPYPRYSKEETTRKLQHALADAGPATCSAIRYDRGGEEYCRECQHWNTIKSPIVLGMRRQRDRPAQPTGDADSESPQQAAEALLAHLATLAKDARKHAILDALPALAHLPEIAWIKLRDQLTDLAPTLKRGDLERARKDELRRAKESQKRHAGESTQIPTPGALPYGDTYNARRLVERYGADLRYCGPWHTWLVWSDTHWQMDDTGKVMRRAKITIESLMDLVKDLPTVVQQQMLLAHIKGSLGTGKLQAMIENAQSELPMPLLPEALDRDGWLLNVANGTLNLRTGTLQPHDRGDFLTRCIPVAYDPEALCPLWESFLKRIMAGNANLIAFLQRAVGYALTGVIREHVLLILWGSGRNGKSTFLNTLRALLGPYAIKASAELLMVSNNDRHPTERTDLFHKRFVAVIETEQGRRMAEVFVKEATGGDPIRARRMREDMWEFQPTHKLFLATNHKPTIKGTDNAIWERMRLIPFTVTIPDTERNTKLPDELLGELQGILAWAVRGCIEWQKNGLGEPEEVTKATAGYRGEMDVIGRFLKEECFIGTTYKVAASLLHKSYQQWSGDTAISLYALKQALEEKGYEQKREKTGQFWQGIGLPAPLVVNKDRKDLGK